MTSAQPLAVIITALPLERTAVVAHLQNITEEPPVGGSIYRRGVFDERSNPWEVIVAEIGAGNVGAAAEVLRVITRYSPKVAIFVGVAGAIKDLKHGDVVASTKIYGYESGKDDKDGFRPRPAVQLAAFELEQRARYEAGEGDWRKRIKGPAAPDVVPDAKVGPIVAGEKVVASNKSRTYQFVRESYGDAVAVEMEGHGFLLGVHMSQPTQGIVIRGISDLINDKDELNDERWQPIAASYAAAFAFQILAKLTLDESGQARMATVEGKSSAGPPAATGSMENGQQLAQSRDQDVEEHARVEPRRSAQSLTSISVTKTALVSALPVSIGIACLSILDGVPRLAGFSFCLVAAAMFDAGVRHLPFRRSFRNAVLIMVLPVGVMLFDRATAPDPIVLTQLRTDRGTGFAAIADDPTTFVQDGPDRTLQLKLIVRNNQTRSFTVRSVSFRVTAFSPTAPGERTGDRLSYRLTVTFVAPPGSEQLADIAERFNITLVSAAGTMADFQAKEGVPDSQLVQLKQLEGVKSVTFTKLGGGQAKINFAARLLKPELRTLGDVTSADLDVEAEGERPEGILARISFARVGVYKLQGRIDYEAYQLLLPECRVIVTR